jgi:hypothetical protein
MRISSHLLAPLAACVLASTAVSAGELYKWVDEKGVVNYSNEPPPKTRNGKPPTIVEDRVSVYTPEESVTEAIKRNKENRAKPAPPAPQPARAVTAAPPPPPPTAAYDPCSNPNDPNCQPGVLYDGSAVFQGRRRHHQPLVQPQLPPGAIAGQMTGPNAYIAGQSGMAPPALPPVRGPRASNRELERETSRRQP